MAKRIGVLGAGLIGRKHAELVARHARLDAIIDPSDTAAALAKQLSTQHFADLTEYLATRAPDGIIIATPNQLHVDHAATCIEHGIPVLIEKPIADNARAVAVLLASADARKVPILVGHHRRHNPLIKAAKAAIDAGRLGDIVAVNAQFWLYKPDDYFAPDWRRQPGAGPVYINLIHDVDLLRHLCGEVTSVQAIQSSKARGFAVEDSAAIVLQFANGAVGTVSVSDTVVAPWSWELTAGENPAYPNVSSHCYTIGGNRASLSIPDMKIWSHPGERSWWEPIASDTLEAGSDDPLVAQLAHFCAVIDGRAAPLVSGAEGLQSLRLVEAIKRAAETGVAQKLA